MGFFVLLLVLQPKVKNKMRLEGFRESLVLDLKGVSYNQITNIKPLVDNPGIGKGDIVGLDGNPLNEKSINEYIPALQARGVHVTV